MAKTEKQVIEEFLKAKKEGFSLLAGEKDEIKKEPKKTPEKTPKITKEKIQEELKKGYMKKSSVDDKKDTEDEDGTAVTTESNPLREAYRAKAKTAALSKLSGIDPEDPLASITGKKTKPPEHQYDIMGRLNVDRRRAQYGIRPQFAMPIKPITGRPLGAKRGCFVTAKVKMGRNRKTKLL